MRRKVRRKRPEPVPRPLDESDMEGEKKVEPKDDLSKLNDMSSSAEMLDKLKRELDLLSVSSSRSQTPANEPIDEIPIEVQRMIKRDLLKRSNEM